MEESQHCSTTEICGPAFERIEDDETNPQVKVTVKVVRSSKFWFQDGNVVLQAEHTQFRLHRSVLSMHCPIFRDMFACSLPENGPTVDGCPLVHFSETLEDTENFIKILYKSIKTYNRRYTVRLSLLRTMLHFGRKYDMRPLRQEAVYCLMLEFPSTLKEWTEHVFGNVIDDSDSDVEGMFEILYLAYEHSITSILPALYLRICLTHNAQEIVEGFQCAAKNLPLDNKLLTNCLLGRERLHRSVSSLTLAWLYDNNALSRSDCKTQCQKRRYMLITKLWNNDILFSLKYAVYPWEDISLSEELCSSCSKIAKVVYGRAQTSNWDQLKTYFGLCDLEDGLDWETSSDSSQSEAVAEELVEDDAGL